VRPDPPCMAHGQQSLPACTCGRPLRHSDLDSGFPKIREVICIWARVVDEEGRLENLRIEMLEQQPQLTLTAAETELAHEVEQSMAARVARRRSGARPMNRALHADRTFPINGWS